MLLGFCISVVYCGRCRSGLSERKKRLDVYTRRVAFLSPWPRERGLKPGPVGTLMGA